MVSPLLALLLNGCDHSGEIYVSTPNPDYPYIQDLGEFRVISAEEYGDKDFDPLSESARADDEAGRHGVYYGGVGAPEDPAFYGGATFTFAGTGGDVCIVLDPEAVYWIQAWSPQANQSAYLYQDLYEDDGDLDLNVGLTAYYTGSPGVSMGDFELPYTDEVGVDHSLEFNECYQAGGDNGAPVHAGRSAIEYCTIDTFGRAGVSFTVVMDTFTLPVDDSVAHFAVALFEGDCGGAVANERALDECFFPQEFGVSQAGEDNQIEDCDDPASAWSYACLEAKFCGNTSDFNGYCEEHFDDGDAPCIDNGVHPPEEDEEATEE